MYIYKIRNVSNLNDFNDQAIALNSKIQVVLKFGDDQLRFTISDGLTVEEETTLDSFVADFVDVDVNVSPKIYQFAKEEAAHKHFHNIDYKKELTVSLIPVRTITKGEVTNVKWYSSLSAELVPENLVIDVDIVYIRDTSGFATSRVVTRTWINEDESENSETKATNKYYFINPSDMIDEGLKRRKLLVNNIQIPVLTFMSEVLMPQGYSQEAVVLMGRDFMDFYESDLNNFVENSSTITDPADENFGEKTVVVHFSNNDSDGINADYNLWLDDAPASLGGLTTIRQYLISEFSI